MENQNLIQLNTIRDIEIALLKSKEDGQIIPDVVFEIITNIEKSYE